MSHLSRSAQSIPKELLSTLRFDVKKRASSPAYWGATC